MKSVLDLISSLDSFCPNLITPQKTSSFFTDVAQIYNDTDFQKNTIYIGYVSQVQNTLRYLNDITLFLISDMDSLVLSTEHNNCVVLFPKTTDLNVLRQKCIATTERKDLLMEDSFQLFNCFLSKGTLSDVIDTASQMIRNPIIVIDISYKILAYSKSYNVNDEQWQKNIKRGYCSYEYVAGFNNIEGVKKSPLSNEPFQIECHTSPLMRCISKLYYKGVQIGYLIAIEAFSSFNELNMDFFKILSNLTAKIVYTNNQLARTVNVDFFDSIFVDALDCAYKTPDAFRERITQTDLNINSNYTILLIDINKYNNYDYNSEHLRTYIMSLFYSCKTVCYRNDVVILIDNKKLSSPIPQILEKAYSYFSENELRVAVSDIFHDLFEIPIYYQQTKETLKIADKLELDSLFLYYDHFKFYSFILAMENNLDYNYYYSNEFKMILQYDKENSTQYCDTIFCYLQCNKKIDAVATKMFIHKNTVSYRINKAKELFDIDLKNQDIGFRFYYSALIYQMHQHQL